MMIKARLSSRLVLGRVVIVLMAGALGVAPSWAQSKEPLYGFLVSVDHPFYSEGDTAWIELNLFNFSSDDAFGFSSSGGLGCRFHVWVEGDRESVVWEVGQCRDGRFTRGTGCPRNIVRIDLVSGSAVVNYLELPLVQNNASSCAAGTNGEPIAAGVYRVCIEKVFQGPNREREFGSRGLNPTACIPVRVIPATEGTEDSRELNLHGRIRRGS